MLSEVVTCNCVRNPGGHAESNPRPSEEEVSFYHVLRPLDIVAHDGVGLRPLLPGVQRHTLLHAKPLWCRRLLLGWRDGCGCTQTAEARRHRRLRGAAAAIPSLPLLFTLSP